MKIYEKWWKWIIEIVKSTTILILVNGNPIEEFETRRGLRHMDHVSSFLFLIEVEGLNVMMNALIRVNNFFH